MVKEYTNKEEGVTAIVTELENGKFCTQLLDNDSGEFLPVCQHCPTFEMAEEYALNWAHLKEK